MRIALLGICHETNTFSPIPTDLAKFEAEGTLRGAEITEKHLTAHSSLAGFLEVGEAPDVEVVPLIWAWANPSGTITAEAFEALSAEALDLLAQNGPWDGVFLAQHGAAVSEDYPDPEAEFVGRVRALVGEDVPIGVAFDLHANVSREVVERANVVVGFLTNPHIDARERAVECGSLIVRAVRGEIRPVTSYRPVDAAINILRQATTEEPMRGIMADARGLLSDPRVLSISVFEGYPYADVAQMGMSCLVITDDDETAAQSYGNALADLLWSRRDGFVGTAIGADEAVRRTATGGPVVLLDAGDNIGAGGDGKSTVLLEAMLDAGVGGGVVILHGPEAVIACESAGQGARVVLDVGREGEHIRIEGTVLRFSDGTFEEPNPTHGGFRFFDTGLTCVVELANDNLVVLTTRVVLPASRQQLVALDIDPSARRLIVAKGVVSPQAGYAPIAGELVLVDTPGVTSADLSRFEYQHRRKPLFPFEAIG